METPEPEPSTPEPVVDVEPAAEVKPPPPAFDGTTIEEADVVITEIVDAGGPPCGVLHSVAAIEVEVLGFGDPRPRIGLYVSCPADLQPRGMLTVGKRLRVVLFAKRQGWPKPANRFGEGLEVRYARRLQPVVGLTL